MAFEVAHAVLTPHRAEHLSHQSQVESAAVEKLHIFGNHRLVVNTDRETIVLVLLNLDDVLFILA